MVHAVAVTPDGRCAVSASAGDPLKVWDIESGEELYTLRDRTGPLMWVAVMPDGRFAVSASADNTLNVWDIESGKIIAIFSGESNFLTCAISPDGVTIIAGEESGRVHFLRLQGVKRTPL